mmetsp:Transcript_116673/g.336993  ORF Transcript_116673/g.336993 Transcript_116673/m.336993 type:complete len:294 (+) Transcript_116673:495-1376(+)
MCLRSVLLRLRDVLVLGLRRPGEEVTVAAELRLQRVPLEPHGVATLGADIRAAACSTSATGAACDDVLGLAKARRSGLPRGPLRRRTGRRGLRALQHAVRHPEILPRSSGRLIIIVFQVLAHVDGLWSIFHLVEEPARTVPAGDLCQLLPDGAGLDAAAGEVSEHALGGEGVRRLAKRARGEQADVRERVVGEVHSLESSCEVLDAADKAANGEALQHCLALREAGLHAEIHHESEQLRRVLHPPEVQTTINGLAVRNVRIVPALLHQLEVSGQLGEVVGLRARVNQRVVRIC